MVIPHCVSWKAMCCSYSVGSTPAELLDDPDAIEFTNVSRLLGVTESKFRTVQSPGWQLYDPNHRFQLEPHRGGFGVPPRHLPESVFKIGFRGAATATSAGLYPTMFQSDHKANHHPYHATANAGV